MNIRILWAEEAKTVLRNVPKYARKAVHDELQDIGLDLKGKAVLLAPVDKGDLRRSAEAVMTEELEMTVLFAERYALRQHEELTWNHPKGGQAKYLEQPFKENVDMYIRSIEERIKGAIDAT